MKTRLVHTRIWIDEYFAGLKPHEKLVFLYLITNDRVNLCGIYELPDRYILMETGITPKQLEDIKTDFICSNKINFYEGWICLVNYDKYSSLNPSMQVGRDKELSEVPESILAYFESFEDEYRQGVDSLLQDGNRMRHRNIYINNNNNNNNINNNTNNIEKEVVKEKKQSIVAECEQINKLYNTIFGKNVSSTVALEENWTHWRSQYDISDVEKALRAAKKDEFWHDKITPTILLRRRNPQKEAVDHIGDLKSRYKTSVVTDPPKAREMLSDEERDASLKTLDEMKTKWLNEKAVA